MPSWPEKRTFIGARTTRIDGPLKVTGAAKYSSDVQPEGWLYGMILRSRWPKARITRINLDNALKIPGIKAAILDREGERTVMAQRYIPEIVDGDKRVLLIAGEVVPYALARIPKAGETRGNLAAGGRGVAQPISARDCEIAEAVGAELVKAGIVFAGLDVIGDYLTEINVTSPTCMVEIQQQTGYDVAGAFITALEHACGQ